MSPASYRAAPPRVGVSTLRHRPDPSKSVGPAGDVRPLTVRRSPGAPGSLLPELVLRGDGPLQCVLQPLLRGAVGREVAGGQRRLALGDGRVGVGERLVELLTSR